MPKLVSGLRPFYVPNQYNMLDITLAVRAICQQVNDLSVGLMRAHYNAASTAPAGVEAAAVGDLVRDSNTTVQASIAPGAAASYVRFGWVCTGDGTPGTWQELRMFTGD